MPVFSTLVVLAAVAVMIVLGFWQLDRADEKAAMKAGYAAAADNPEVLDWPALGADGKPQLYRRARLVCAPIAGSSSIAGRNAKGESGLAVTAECLTPEGEPALVVLGWQRAPERIEWGGGTVTGIVAPGPRLVADPPVAGLQASALPDPSEVPDNHLAYAVQWFFFAVIALVIYALAVRKRLAGRDGPR
nr:SURF1 family cytochrome oxidase biogenesis protein [Novosphingobium marinum]